jgi:hypothetical protein
MSTPVKPPNPKEAAERSRRRHGRNLAVFFALLAFVVLIYAVTITKIRMGYGP